MRQMCSGKLRHLEVKRRIIHQNQLVRLFAQQGVLGDTEVLFYLLGMAQHCYHTHKSHITIVLEELYALFEHTISSKPYELCFRILCTELLNKLRSMNISRRLTGDNEILQDGKILFGHHHYLEDITGRNELLECILYTLRGNGLHSLLIISHEVNIITIVVL